MKHEHEYEELLRFLSAVAYLSKGTNEKDKLDILNKNGMTLPTECECIHECKDKGKGINENACTIAPDDLDTFPMDIINSDIKGPMPAYYTEPGHFKKVDDDFLKNINKYEYPKYPDLSDMPDMPDLSETIKKPTLADMPGKNYFLALDDLTSINKMMDTLSKRVTDIENQIAANTLLKDRITEVEQHLIEIMDGGINNNSELNKQANTNYYNNMIFNMFEQSLLTRKQTLRELGFNEDGTRPDKIKNLDEKSSIKNDCWKETEQNPGYEQTWAQPGG